MNQTTRRNLIKFLKLEANKAKTKAREKFDNESSAVIGKIQRFSRDITNKVDALVAKEAKKVGLTLKPNRGNHHDRYDIASDRFKEYPGSFYDCPEFTKRLQVIDDALAETEKSVLLNDDVEASKVLEEFVAKLNKL